MSLEESTNCSKYSNIFQILRTREIGSLSGVKAERDYCQIIASNKTLINEYSLNSYLPCNIHDVKYIKGTPSFILGIWYAGGCYVLSHQPLVADRSLPYYKVKSHHIADFCEGMYGTITYIYYESFLKSGLVDLRLQSADFPFPNRRINKHLKKSHSYCISSTTDASQCAVGSLKEVQYIDRVSCKSLFFPVFNESRACTISFNQSSNLMVMGSSTGYVSLGDIRMKKVVKNISASDYCINESYFLEPDQIIAAGEENVLCRIDLRTDRIVTDYFGHITKTDKSSLSVANNMLCAAGADNVIRIWHLSGGNPIHEIGSFISPRNTVRGWLFSQANKTYLYHFEADFRKTFSIT